MTTDYMYVSTSDCTADTQENREFLPYIFVVVSGVFALVFPVPQPTF